MEDKKKQFNPEEIIGKNAYSFSLFEIEMFARADRDKLMEYISALSDFSKRINADANDESFKAALILFSRMSNETMSYPKLEKLKPGIA